MPKDTSFAVLYKKLVDRNFEPDPQQLARTKRLLFGQLSALGPPAQADQKQIWTIPENYDTIRTFENTGESEK